MTLYKGKFHIISEGKLKHYSHWSDNSSGRQYFSTEMVAADTPKSIITIFTTNKDPLSAKRIVS